MSRVLLDTNAAIDLVFARDKSRSQAMVSIMTLMRETEDVVLLPSLSIKDISYFIECNKDVKALIPSRSERLDLARQARELLFSTCTICGIDEDIARKAHQNLSEPDYDDALVAECALAYDAEVIISSDAEAFERSIVPKASPQRYAKLMAKRNQAQN